MDDQEGRSRRQPRRAVRESSMSQFELLDRTLSMFGEPSQATLDREWTRLTEECGVDGSSYANNFPQSGPADTSGVYSIPDGDTSASSINRNLNDSYGASEGPGAAMDRLRVGSMMMEPTVHTAHHQTNATYDMDDTQEDILVDQDDRTTGRAPSLLRRHVHWQQQYEDNEMPAAAASAAATGREGASQIPMMLPSQLHQNPLPPNNTPINPDYADYNTDVNDEKQCRICYSGAEDDPSLGRLISPCQCRGTMRYVHLGCLNQWRHVSGNRSSFFQCDQCKYKYMFRRATMASIVMHPVILFLISAILFCLLVLMAGFCTKILARVCFSSSQGLQFDDLDEGEAPAEPELLWVGDGTGQFDEMLSLTTIDPMHAMLGLVLVGFIGFVQFVFGSYVIGPVPIFGGYRMRLGGHGGGGNGGQRGGGGMGAAELVMVAVIVIGAVRALWTIYQSVRSVCERQLDRLGSHILDVPELPHVHDD